MNPCVKRHLCKSAPIPRSHTAHVTPASLITSALASKLAAFFWFLIFFFFFSIIVSTYFLHSYTLTYFLISCVHLYVWQTRIQAIAPSGFSVFSHVNEHIKAPFCTVRNNTEDGVLGGKGISWLLLVPHIWYDIHLFI